MEKKYKLTEETITIGTKTLHRIEALRRFDNVEKGDKGGFIESEDNLSHEGNSWIYDEARVYDKAKILDNAIIHDHAVIREYAEVSGNALVMGKASIRGVAKVCGTSTIKDKVDIYDEAIITGYSTIEDNSSIHGKAKIEGSYIKGYIRIGDEVIISKGIRLEGIGTFIGDAIISSEKDYIIFKNWWSSGRYFTWTRSNNMWCVGCFYGTGEELIKKAYNDSILSGREYERIVKYVESILNE